MRRTLSLFVMMLTAAVANASAQARAHLGVRLRQQEHGSGPPDLVVHVSDLLNDPQWHDALTNAYPLRLHWRVVLWQSRAVVDRSLNPVEWDDIIQQVPVMDEYTFQQRTAKGDTTWTFSTADSLARWVESEARVPTPPNLAPGRWYYTVDLHIAAEPQSDQHGTGDDETNGLSQLFQRVILGGGPRTDLPRARTATFTVVGP